MTKQKEILKIQPLKPSVQASNQEEDDEVFDPNSAPTLSNENYELNEPDQSQEIQQQQYMSDTVASEQPLEINGSSYYYEGNENTYLPSGDQGVNDYYDSSQYQYADNQQPIQYLSNPQNQYVEDQQQVISADQNYMV